MPAIGATSVGVQCELLSVGHGWLVVVGVRRVPEGSELSFSTPYFPFIPFQKMWGLPRIPLLT